MRFRIPSRIRRRLPFSSRRYWNERYLYGGNSGLGSYGRLAKYKAAFINDFAARRGITEAVEFGSGDGNQCALFDFQRYTGIDVSRHAVVKCHKMFSDREGWQFYHVSDRASRNVSAPLTLSLDVIYHLIEDYTFERYMRRLFDGSTHYVLIYSSDWNKMSGAKHIRHRKYTDWISRNRADFVLEGEWAHPFPMTPNSDPKETSFAHFKLFARSA